MHFPAAQRRFSLLLSIVTVGSGLTLPGRAAEMVAPALAASAAPAALPDAARAVYQQRGADGKTVFTDRPAAGLVTERRWLIEPEDPAAAAARREASREEADRITERIQRSIDQQQQRDTELQIEQLRSQRATDAEQARRRREREYEADLRPYVLLPGRPYGQPYGSPYGQTYGRPAGRPPLGLPPPTRDPGARSRQQPDPVVRSGPRAPSAGPVAR